MKYKNEISFILTILCFALYFSIGIYGAVMHDIFTFGIYTILTIVIVGYNLWQVYIKKSNLESEKQNENSI